MNEPTYSDLAAELRSLADQLAKLDAQGLRPVQNAYFSLSFGYLPSAAPQTVPAVNAVAAALGLTAETKYEGRGANRTGEHEAKNGRDTALMIRVRTSVPVPPTRAKKLADLQRENDELRAHLAAKGGAA